MNTYRKAAKVVSILLLVVFIFASVQPVRSYSPRGQTSYQSHLENIAVPIVPDWQKVFLNVKSRLIGTTWAILLRQVFNSDALRIGVNEFSHFFLTPSINAP